MTIRLKQGFLAIGVSAVVATAVAIPANAAVGVQANPPSWGLDRVDQRKGVDQSYHYETTADDVTAYVIDSGVEAKQADFGGRVEAGKDFVDGTPATADPNGNGTHLAGIIGGATYGLAKGVHIVPVRVIDQQGGGSIDSILAAIDWVTKNAQQPAVALLGIGGVPNAQLDTAVQGLAAVMPVAVPAGGQSADVSGYSPARVSEALTVGASDTSDKVAANSNFGAGVDLYAPGVDVPSLTAGSTASSTRSGTSVAAAYVVGAAALYRSLHPDASPADVCKALVAAATPGALTGVPAGTPNLLLYTLTPPPPAPPTPPSPTPTPTPTPIPSPSPSPAPNS
jgi:subtilisin family serine protease